MRRPPLHSACKIFPALGQEDLQELADDYQDIVERLRDEIRQVEAHGSP